MLITAHIYDKNRRLLITVDRYDYSYVVKRFERKSAWEENISEYIFHTFGDLVEYIIKTTEDEGYLMIVKYDPGEVLFDKSVEVLLLTGLITKQKLIADFKEYIVKGNVVQYCFA